MSNKSETAKTQDTCNRKMMLMLIGAAIILTIILYNILLCELIDVHIGVSNSKDGVRGTLFKTIALHDGVKHKLTKDEDEHFQEIINDLELMIKSKN